MLTAAWIWVIAGSLHAVIGWAMRWIAAMRAATLPVQTRRQAAALTPLLGERGLWFVAAGMVNLAGHLTLAAP